MNRRAAILTALLLAGLSPELAAAQEPERTTSLVFVYEPGTTIEQGAVISQGLRRGIRNVEGVRFVHPVDALTQIEYDPDVDQSLGLLDSVADMVRTGDAAYAAEQADHLVELFEDNLLRVSRSQLVDAYMLSAVAHCRSGDRRQCQERFRQVVAFREGLEYDEARYGPEGRDEFDRTRLRTINGRRGTLVIETEPTGAEVYIDGRSYGPSPVRAEGLLAGGHYVTLKEINHLKQIVRVEVRGSRENTEIIELEPNSEAQLVASESVQDHLRNELGEPRALQTIQSVGRRLGTTQLIIGVLRPAAGGSVHVNLYLYHMRTRHLQSNVQETLTVDEAGMEIAAELAGRLYEGVDLDGGIEAPEDETEIVEPQPEVYEQWWFWTAIGGGVAVVVAGIVIGVVLAGDATQGPPDGQYRILFGRLP